MPNKSLISILSYAWAHFIIHSILPSDLDFDCYTLSCHRQQFKLPDLPFACLNTIHSLTWCNSWCDTTVGKRRQSLPTKWNKYKQNTYKKYSLHNIGAQMHVALITKAIWLNSLQTWMMCVYSFFFIGKVLLAISMIKKYTSPETKFVRLLSAWHLIESWHEGVLISLIFFAVLFKKRERILKLQER